MKTRLKPLAALLPFIFITPLHAQQVLDPVVVTATRMESRVSETLADLTVIDRAEIERSSADTIVELLARQPGLQAATNGGPGTTGSFYLRGARPDQTKVLVDGLVINSIDLTGSPLYHLPLAHIERIEILRGPASTLYGADAIGGVIQIFTRQASPGLKADGFIGYGTKNTLKTNAGIAGGDAQWRFRLDASHESTDGISAQKNATRQDADQDGYRNTGYSASAAFLPVQGHETGLIYRQNEGRNHYDSGNVPANGTTDDYLDFRTRQWQLYTRNHLTESWSSKLQYGQTLDWQKNVASWAPTGSVLETKNEQLSWQNDLSLPLGKAVLGAEQLKQTAGPTGSFTGTDTATQRALFAGWNASSGAHRWQISGRNDDHSQFDGKHTYALAYGYQLSPQWRVHASHGTAFKAPSLYQLYDQWTGNAQLKAESSRNNEATLIWAQTGHRVSATYYRNRVSDMIDWSSSTFTFMNVSRARLEGLTLDYSGRIDDWQLTATYDALKALNETTGFRLGRRAKNRLQLSLTRQWGALEGGLEASTAGPRYDSNRETGRMGGYSLLNLTTRYAFSKNLAVEGRINNLLDKQYELTQGYNTQGINAFIGLRYTP
ncbi:MAG: TonB-dependent receptor [Sterolibacterium sp.]|nr:TonB-dependent receptor [Sterolibacterium sp.]